MLEGVLYNVICASVSVSRQISVVSYSLGPLLLRIADFVWNPRAISILNNDSAFSQESRCN